jgi:hypothetical protein
MQHLHGSPEGKLHLWSGPPQFKPR